MLIFPRKIRVSSCQQSHPRNLRVTVCLRKAAWLWSSFDRSAQTATSVV
jgi:hypothetical protein